MSEQKSTSKRKAHGKKSLSSLPVLPLRDVVVYPCIVIPLFVGREISVKALEYAMKHDSDLVLLAQVDSTQENPLAQNLYTFGSVATILQLLRLPDGTLKVLVEGKKRIEVKSLTPKDDCIMAEVQVLKDRAVKSDKAEVLLRSLASQFENYVKLNKKVPPEITHSLMNITDLGKLTDTIASHINLKLEERQELLETLSVANRVELLMSFIERETELLKVEKNIRGRVRRQMEDNQKEYYLNEQMKAIQTELGDGQSGWADLNELEKKIRKAQMPKEALEKTMSELAKLKATSPMSAESTVSRNYIDYMVSFPWKKSSRLSHDLNKAQEILDEDHYGLEKVKERMLEYLAVQLRVKKFKGPILCFVGPPGVGKTSLGSSIARATGRKFIRMSLGGLRDEAEIRGHRRTYIGSMPGKIIQKIIKSGVRNPVFVLDEIDKLASDFRGDPSSALLEVLDPEQNFAFNDHYLEVDCDLSDVMFIATSNSYNIPPALYDRMETIRLAGYTEDEKYEIVKRHLLPKQIEAAGLKPKEFKINEQCFRDIFRYYTREAGVRSLDRELSKLCQKSVKRILMGETKSVSITPKNLDGFLGVRKYSFGLADKNDQVGQVTGLAWTEVGGELLKVEASLLPGKGKVVSTGQLGDVMQESIKAAMTVIRDVSSSLGFEPDYFQQHDIHLHVPDGATPKDGPSAGIAMCTAILSIITQAPVKADVAMTGEITLRGKVLPIGGLKEKLLAALRGGIKTVMIPKENEKDLVEISDEIKTPLKIVPVEHIDEVFKVAMSVPIKAKVKSRSGKVKRSTTSSSKKSTAAKRKKT